MPRSSVFAIDMAAVAKSFGEVTALAGVDLRVEAGSIAALLGPNGAGKTTLVRIAATLTVPDSGHARVLGFDAVSEPYEVRSRIGLTGQYAGLDEGLSGRDNLVLVGRLAGLGRREARLRAGELTEQFGLAGAIGRAVRTYSGGMRRRLDLAASLTTRPRLLILDEPTTGLDPAGRTGLWAALAELRAEGTTMLLTTQYLEEADRFADVVHVIDHGRMVASGTAAELKARAGTQVIEVRLTDTTAAAAATRAVTARLGAPPAEMHGEPGRLVFAAHRGVQTLLDAAGALHADGIEVADIGLRKPSLDEAFLALTQQRPGPPHPDGRAAS